jgi:3-phenylpropionate/trans-cinnamate dioxygenase ferredoxin reductase component
LPSDTPLQRIVIVGGGQAAVQAADTLRREGFEGSLTMVSGESGWPYQRPPLSKACLAVDGGDPPLLKPETFYAERQVDLRRGRQAVAIDRNRGELHLDDGERLPWDRLLLATGGRLRRLPAIEAAAPGRVHYLKGRGDAAALRTALAAADRVTVIGGGFIGLEFAAAARKRGLAVSLHESADRLLGRVTRAEVSRHLQSVHAQHGVELHFGAGAPDPAHAELVLVGVGALPEDDLARDAGLHCQDGIVVDAACRTSDPRIFAAGDCTRSPRAGHPGLWRLESVDNAITQGTVAARSMLGRQATLDAVPWFWSDQYDQKLIIIGLSMGHDEVVLRGDPVSGAFSLCYLQQGRLLAVDCMNRAADSVAARKLVAAGARMDRLRAADPATPLKDAILTPND